MKWAGRTGLRLSEKLCARVERGIEDRRHQSAPKVGIELFRGLFASRYIGAKAIASRAIRRSSSGDQVVAASAIFSSTRGERYFTGAFAIASAKASAADPGGQPRRSAPAETPPCSASGSVRPPAHAPRRQLRPPSPPRPTAAHCRAAPDSRRSAAPPVPAWLSAASSASWRLRRALRSRYASSTAPKSQQITYPPSPRLSTPSTRPAVLPGRPAR